MTSHLPALRRNEAGAAVVEYVVICGLVLCVSVGLANAVGENVNTLAWKIHVALGRAEGQPLASPSSPATPSPAVPTEPPAPHGNGVGQGSGGGRDGNNGRAR